MRARLKWPLILPSDVRTSFRSVGGNDTSSFGKLKTTWKVKILSSGQSMIVYRRHSSRENRQFSFSLVGRRTSTATDSLTQSVSQSVSRLPCSSSMPRRQARRFSVITDFQRKKRPKKSRRSRFPRSSLVFPMRKKQPVAASFSGQSENSLTMGILLRVSRADESFKILEVRYRAFSIPFFER